MLILRKLSKGAFCADAESSPNMHSTHSIYARQADGRRGNVFAM